MFIDNPLPFSNSLKHILIFLNLFLPSFITLFINFLDTKGRIPLLASFPPSFSRIFSQSLQTPFLIFILHICKELRDFCGFSKVPDAPLFHTLRSVFRITLHSCSSGWWIIPNPSARRSILPLPPCLLSISPTLIFYVFKNNPKTLNSLIHRLKAYYRNNPDVDPYKMAYDLMPSQAASCPDAKQQYINGHFCYADKFAILTNWVIPLLTRSKLTASSRMHSTFPGHWSLSIRETKVPLKKLAITLTAIPPAPKTAP